MTVSGKKGYVSKLGKTTADLGAVVAYSKAWSDAKTVLTSLGGLTPKEAEAWRESLTRQQIGRNCKRTELSWREYWNLLECFTATAKGSRLPAPLIRASTVPAEEGDYPAALAELQEPTAAKVDLVRGLARQLWGEGFDFPLSQQLRQMAGQNSDRELQPRYARRARPIKSPELTELEDADLIRVITALRYSLKRKKSQ